MIWFACKKCGKRHGRPESQAGTLVFCECGHGNRVPWASTATLDAEPAEPVPAPRPAPRPPRAREAGPPAPAPAPAELPLPPRRPGRLVGKVNPNFCFQHDEAASEATCAACRLPFCKSCVVELEGQTLCGPCKNFRVAGQGQPLRVLPLAVVALVVSLTSGPVALTLSLAGAALFLEGVLGVAVAMCLLAGALPATGFFLSGLALRRIDARPHAGGRGLAASGACAALAGVVWSVTVALVIVGKRVLD